MVLAGLMFRRREGLGDPKVRLTADTARELLPLLLGTGFGVGFLSGFFGIGGGFLIVPGLMFATGMPPTLAIGTSLVAVAAFGAATAGSYAASGLINWNIAALFILGRVVGGMAGVALGRVLAGRKRALSFVFAGVVVSVGVYVVARAIIALV